MEKKPVEKIFNPIKDITLTTDASEHSNLDYHHKKDIR